MNLKKI